MLIGSLLEELNPDTTIQNLKCKTPRRSYIPFFTSNTFGTPCPSTRAVGRPKLDAMIIPVRCFTCGKVIGNKWETYLSLLQADFNEGDALDELGLKRYCCRRMVLTHVDLIEKLLNYNCKDEFTLIALVNTGDQRGMAEEINFQDHGILNSGSSGQGLAVLYCHSCVEVFHVRVPPSVIFFLRSSPTCAHGSHLKLRSGFTRRLDPMDAVEALDW